MEILIRYFMKQRHNFSFCKNYSNYTVVIKIFRFSFFWHFTSLFFIFFDSVDLVSVWFSTYVKSVFFTHGRFYTFYIVNSVCANIAVLLGWDVWSLFLLPYISLLTPRAFSINTTPSGQVSMLRDRKALTPIKHAHTMST